MVEDIGNRDSIANNTISGVGYNRAYAPTSGSFYGTVDVSCGSTNSRIVHNK